ncbi:DUF1062 domain-containing protein [Microbispora bryophytorum]|uniref:DUF1062 domain-containing protein n=1 Tax=Microbispora bryophytorum TaxID=1460882 RepID=UPI001E45B7B6|nr:DUF1062 domain-containing protein [Microbispora bryophytorum]
MLPWVVRRTRLPLLSSRCVDCRSESATTGEGRFRVNANGKLLDVWLLVRCVSCGRTSRLGVHERAPVGSFDPAELERYHANDPELVAATLLDPLFVRRSRVALDWQGAWRLDTPSAWLDAPGRRTESGPRGRPSRAVVPGIGSRDRNARRVWRRPHGLDDHRRVRSPASDMAFRGEGVGVSQGRESRRR